MAVNQNCMGCKRNSRYLPCLCFDKCDAKVCKGRQDKGA